MQEQTLCVEILQDTNEMVKYRRQRLIASNADLPHVMWITVVIGGLITIGFTALFGCENLRLHLIMTGLLALLIGFVIYVVVQMNHPFV